MSNTIHASTQTPQVNYCAPQNETEQNAKIKTRDKVLSLLTDELGEYATRSNQKSILEWVISELNTKQQGAEPKLRLVEDTSQTEPKVQATQKTELIEFPDEFPDHSDASLKECLKTNRQRIATYLVNENTFQNFLSACKAREIFPDGIEAEFCEQTLEGKAFELVDLMVTRCVSKYFDTGAAVFWLQQQDIFKK
ncbi:hypothetical protein [Endozoicomonas elysicola]|uniref:Uncharacterized protein n=1 Tax=Endozoicomonas elysicola TaxID=305900 RepID=A0A081K6Y6_9GAMM|nr:hypothetical protein [Endozoicomonas elysicola]KEI69912.1 hypothetical protein GV64_03385 [Endozoicomonas elysicola]